MAIKLFKQSAKFFTLAALLTLSSCVSTSDQIEGSINRIGKPVVTVVHFYDNTEEVQNKYRELHNLPRSQKVGVQGFALWQEHRDADGKPIEVDDKPHTCVIHVVRPVKVDDEATKTLGHEMLHCLIGTYHPQADGL